MTFNPYLLLLSTCFCTNIIKLKINNARPDIGFNKIFRYSKYMYTDRDYRAPGLSVALLIVWFLVSGLPVELMLELLDEK